MVYQRFADAPLEARAEGRFNRPNEGPTTYLSLTRRTAALEVAKRWGVTRTNRAAYLVFQVPVRLRQVVDLTDPETAAALGVSRQTLTGSDLAPCQALASRLRAARVEGILTWSSADPDEKNLVVFLDRLNPGSSVGPPAALGRLKKEEQ
jgi:RES domain-containing protein